MRYNEISVFNAILELIQTNLLYKSFNSATLLKNYLSYSKATSLDNDIFYFLSSKLNLEVILDAYNSSIFDLNL